MADLDMTVDEREAFLADVHIGIVSIQRCDRAPLALPIWYRWDGTDVILSMDGDSLKARLLARTGRATLTVQTEAPPYRYVMVEGPVTIGPPDPDTGAADGLALATRYLGPELGAWYAEQNPPSEGSVIVRLRPEQWITCDYSKMRG